MPFIKRLGYYLAGLSVGIIFLAIFLKNKTEETGTEFCYLPNCRVLKQLRSQSLSYSDDLAEMMAKGQLDSTDIAYFLEGGDIDFKNSDTRSEPCKTYRINATLRDSEAMLLVRSCDSVLIAEHLAR
jgi:hypothetical protein